MGSDEGGSWWYRNRQRSITINNDEVREFLRRLSDEVARGAEFAVLVTSDEAVRRANRAFRGQAKTTDVLSFPDGEDGRLGDVMIAAGRAAKQAAERGLRPTDEIKVLALHGLLHLQGYDHETDGGRMARREKQLRKKFRLEAGLIERAESC